MYWFNFVIKAAIMLHLLASFGMAQDGSWVGLVGCFVDVCILGVTDYLIAQDTKERAKTEILKMSVDLDEDIK